ncbi:MAG: competence protein ComEC [Bacteroidia bacterium]|jgi:competence protein ComEC
MLSGLKRIPMLRLLVPFLFGLIGFAFLIEQVSIDIDLVWWILGVLSLQIFILIVFRKTDYTLRWTFGSLVNLVFVGLGAVTTLINSPELYPNNLVHDDGTEKEWLLEVDEEPIEKERSIKLSVNAISLDSSEISGKAFIYLEKSDSAKTLKNGDRLLISAVLNPITTPGNPHEFNYPRYLRFHGVFRQAYVTSDRWIRTGARDGFNLLGSLADLRTILLNQLDRNIFSENERAIVAALTLGYKQELDPETTRAFAGAGAMHVLAVSGLHVGILYTMIMMLFGFLTKVKHGDMIRAFLVIGLLLSYAALTGMSASVFRASIMFSFVAWARASKRYSNIYNTLTASAFLLLLFDPYLIMQVGFQLSYAAVLGIVFIHPWLFSQVVVKNRFLDWAWNITCVSIAAQVATFPLGLLYFHQFPNYFLFSNWVVIPLATFIMYAGMAFFGLGWIPLLKEPLAIVLKWLAWLLNEFVILIESLPFSMLQGIDITVIETGMIYTALISIFVLIMERHFRLIYVALSCMGVFLVFQIHETIDQQNQEALIIYNARKGFAMDLIAGTDHMFIANSGLVQDKNAMLFHVEHNWWARGLSEAKTVTTVDSAFSSLGNLFKYRGETIWIAPIKINSTPKLEVDRIIISGSEKNNWNSILEVVGPTQVVVGQNLNYGELKRLRLGCEEKQIELYQCKKKGPLLL